MPNEDTAVMQRQILQAIRRIELGEEETLPYEPNKAVVDAIKSEVEAGFSSAEELRTNVQKHLATRLTGLEGVVIGMVIGYLLRK